MKTLAALLLLVTATRCFADGGVVVLREETGGLLVTVFASPTPLSVGAVDVGVLVQNRSTHEAIPDASVRISLINEAGVPPSLEWATICSSLNGLGTVADARRSHSTNRLLHSAWLALPSAGDWRLEVLVTVGGKSHTLSQVVRVLPAPTPLAAWWPVIAMVPLGIAAFGLREYLLRHRRRESLARGLSSGERIRNLPSLK